MIKRAFDVVAALLALILLSPILLWVALKVRSRLGSPVIFRQRRPGLNGEPFEEYIKPFGGGYFFVLPGAADPSRYLGQSLLESA